MNSSQHPSSLARKIALTWLVATAPLLASTVFYIVTYANRDSAFVERELAGTRVLRPLDALMENLPAHQRLAHPPAGAGPTDPARLAASQAQIGSRFAAAGRMYAEFARTAPRRAAGVRPGPDLATLAAEWRELGDLPEPAAAASRARYDHLLGNLRETIRQIGNSSNLILDPELDSYFLADLVVDVLPRAQNRLATLEQLGRRILRPAEPARLDRAELAITAAQLRESDVALIDLDVRTALEEDMNFHGMSPSLQQRVPPAARNYAETHARLLHLLDGLAADTPPDVTEEALLSAVDQARAAGFGLWRAAVAELDQLLELRLNIYRRYRLWAYAFIGLAFVSSTGMTVAMARSVTARIHTEQEAERETRRHNAELERRVAERTTQLTATVAELERALAK